jgi:metal-responsive CopG/Arc/MetJ family transcriptional regulator
VGNNFNFSQINKDMKAVMTKENKTQNDKVRVQFDFNKESLEKLDEIVKTINVSTRAEAIRKALTILTEFIDAESRGAKMMLKEKDGTLIQIMPLF